jgi:hypothetical protein
MKAYFQLGSGTVIETDDARIWQDDKGAVRLSAAAGKRALLAESLATLREALKPGDTVWTKVTHVSRSGMSRNIQCFIIRDNEPWNISAHVARVIGEPCDRRDLSFRIGGCGMDMCFAAVYALSSALFRDGFGCIGEGKEHGTRCPSNDHSNGDRDYAPHQAGEPKTFDGGGYCRKPLTWAKAGRVHWHQSGGYALRKRDM